MITEERLRELFHYDAETGVFTRRAYAGQSRNHRIGSVAGYIGAKGYTYLGVEGRYYFAHRLAWLYVHGRWPNAQIDHINGIRSDNRLVNLREASAFENQRNRKRGSDKVVNAKGVSIDRGRFRARIRLAGRSVSLGSFSTIEEAKSAYAQAAITHFGSFSNLG